MYQANMYRMKAVKEVSLDFYNMQQLIKNKKMNHLILFLIVFKLKLLTFFSATCLD
jgi:hypothetical protein